VVGVPFWDHWRTRWTCV